MSESPMTPREWNTMLRKIDRCPAFGLDGTYVAWGIPIGFWRRARYELRMLWFRCFTKHLP